MLSAVTVATTSCTGAVSGAVPQARLAHVPWAPLTRRPASATSVLGGAPAVVAARAAQQLFASSPVVVVASAHRPADLRLAAAQAERAHAPLLLAAPGTAARPGQAGGQSAAAGTGAAPGTAQAAAAASAALRAEISALHARAVLAVGVAGPALSAQLPRTRVVTDPSLLPATGRPVPMAHVVLLVPRGTSRAGTVAAAATARAAGVRVITVRGGDPRADPAAITALSAARPQQVLAIGAGFGPARRLASRVAAAATGVQLPGGGQVLFPMHRLVALYGHPGAPSLGALGQQGLPASIARARKAARSYRALSSVPVVPAFEIIATVAQGRNDPGPDGSYSYASTVASLRPWVKRATAAGFYVVLDLQAGRASLLGQAQRYQSLLKRPNVGLALDPEWKLQPGQLPLQQIGSVGAADINRVSSWLAALTARYHLPQKLLVLHQFRLSMIRGERQLDTRHDDLAVVVHMDGQGTPASKQQTWDAVTGAAPAGVYFGWKNFYAKDHPMLGPRQTMARTPQPVMISYQ